MSQLLKNLKETQKYHEFQADPLAHDVPPLDHSPLKKRSIVLRCLFTVFLLSLCFGGAFGVYFIALSFKSPTTEDQLKITEPLVNPRPGLIPLPTLPSLTVEKKTEIVLPPGPIEVAEDLEEPEIQLPSMQRFNLTTINVNTKPIAFLAPPLSLDMPRHDSFSAPSLEFFIGKHSIHYAKKKFKYLESIVQPWIRSTGLELFLAKEQFLPNTDSPTFISFFGKQISHIDLKKTFSLFPNPEQLSISYSKWFAAVKSRPHVVITERPKPPLPQPRKALTRMHQNLNVRKNAARQPIASTSRTSASRVKEASSVVPLQPILSETPTTLTKPTIEFSSLPQNSLILRYLENLKITSLRIEGQQSKVKLGDDMYYAQSIVSQEFKLKLIEISPEELIFVDENNTKYSKKIAN